MRWIKEDDGSCILFKPEKRNISMWGTFLFSSNGLWVECIDEVHKLLSDELHDTGVKYFDENMRFKHNMFAEKLIPTAMYKHIHRKDTQALCSAILKVAANKGGPAPDALKLDLELEFYLKHQLTLKSTRVPPAFILSSFDDAFIYLGALSTMADEICTEKEEKKLASPNISSTI